MKINCTPFSDLQEIRCDCEFSDDQLRGYVINLPKWISLGGKRTGSNADAARAYLHSLPFDLLVRAWP